MDKSLLYEGDGILLYCEKAKGFIFSPPPLDSSVSTVSIHSLGKSTVTYPGFPDVHYASFRIKPRTCGTSAGNNDGDQSKVNKTLVYGRKVFLYHVASKWYLSFQEENEKEKSTASMPQMARLVDVVKKATVFRIIPSDPSRSIGQTIKVEDSVRLEIVDEPGQRPQVLCAPNILNFRGYDLKKASDGSDFMLYSQSSGEKLGPPLALRGGEVIMFINEKRDAFFTVIKEEKETSEYKVVARVSDGSRSRSDVSGGSSYWQIENAAVQYNGNWVDPKKSSWDVRIKHLPTKRYLSLEDDKGNFKFKLEQDGNSPNSVFQLSEDQLESDMGLLKRRYTLIQHKETKKFVSLSSRSELINGNRCFEISTQDATDDISTHRDQKFWIEEVDDETLNKFSKLSGAFITLKKYLEKLIQAEDTGAKVAEPTDILESLANWTENVSKKGQQTQAKWPDMLRAMEGVELVLEFLNRKKPSTTNIQKKLCKVLESYIKYASKESQLYLISKEKLLKTLFPLMGCKIGAEDVLSELIRCYSFGLEEKKQVVKFFGGHDILNTVLEKEQNFPFLKCLSALCMSGGRPERKIQNDLVDTVIIPGHKKGIFFRIIQASKDKVNIKEPKNLVADEEMKCEFLTIQLEFYASVCQGVNLDCIKKLTADKVKCDGEEEEMEILSYDAAELCIIPHAEHSPVHVPNMCRNPKVQSAIYGFLVSSMVDKNAEESGTDLENIWYIYSWARFMNKEESFRPVTLSAIADNLEIISDKEHMKEMQNQIQASLEPETWKADIDAGREDLMTQKLCVLETLVAYGFYWRSDLKGYVIKVPSPSKVIEALIEILIYKKEKSQHEGKKESEHDGQKESQLDEKKESGLDEKKKTQLTKLQSKAITILNLFLHQTYHLGTSRLLYDYRYLRYMNDTNHCLSVKNQEGYCIPKDELHQLINPKFDVERYRSLVDHIPVRHRKNQVVLDRLRWVLYEEEYDKTRFNFPGLHRSDKYEYEHLNVYDENSKVKKLEGQLIKFMSSDESELCVTAAKLFFDLYKGESFMLQRSEDAYVVVESNKSSFETYTTMVKYATYQDKERDTFIRSLLRLIQGKGPEVKDNVVSFTYDVIDTAGNPPGVNGFSPKDETFTVKPMQDIVLTTGVFGVLLNYVIKYSVTDDTTQTELIGKVCAALLSIARENDDAKKIVLSRFDDLLQARLGIASIARLLTQVLTDNIEGCRTLPLSTVRRMFRMAVIKDTEDKTDCYELIPTIEAWMKVKKSSPRILKTHQRFVASLFDQYFKDYHETSWDPKTSPAQTVKNEEHCDKFALLTHMLAVCCEGIHKYCEDIARNIFSFSALLDIIVDKEITFERRLPFAMILNEAFLNAERESLVSVTEFAEKSSIWKHVTLMTELLDELDKQLGSWVKVDEESGKVTKSKEFTCQMIKVKLVFSQFMTHMYWKKHKVLKVNLKKPPFKNVEISHGEEESKTTVELGVFYQYLIEGLVPMLSVFAVEYEKMLKLYEDRLDEESKPLSDENADLLRAFGRKMEELVSDETKYRDIFVSTENMKEYWESMLKPIVCFGKNRKVDVELLVHGYDAPKADPEKENQENINKEFQVYLENFRTLLEYESDGYDADSLTLFPRGPGFRLLVEQLFPLNNDGEKISDSDIERVKGLVRLLEFLHKQISHSFNTKEIVSLNKLVINILQVFSGAVNQILPLDEDKPKDVEKKYEHLHKWQKVLRTNKVHKVCMMLLNNDDDEVALQVLGLLRLMTFNANIRAQNALYEEISDRDSTFCAVVYCFLCGVMASFRESWAEPQIKNKESSENDKKPKDSAKNGSTNGLKKGVSFEEEETDDGLELLHMSPPFDEKEQQHTSVISVPREQASPQQAGAGTLDNESLENNIRTASIVLDCIAAICDGQHRKVQMFLFDQNQSLKKLDIIKTTAILLQVMTEEYKRILSHETVTTNLVHYYLELIQKAMQALIETTAGNFQNQQAVFQCQITDTVNYLLKNLVEDEISTDEKKSELCDKAIELLVVLLEETDDDSWSLITNFAEDVDLAVIIDAMFEWKQIGTYHILRIVANAKGVTVDNLVYRELLQWLCADDKTKINLWKDFKARSRSIEILYQPRKDEDKKILTKVYFDFDPLDEVKEENKDTVTYAITEEAHEENLTEWNEWGRAIRKNAHFMQENFLNNGRWIWLFRAVYETSGPRHMLLVFLTVLLNLMVLGVFTVPEDATFNSTGSIPNYFPYPQTPFWYFPVLLPVLGTVHIWLSLWMIAEFLIRERPNFTTDVFFVTFAKNNMKSLMRWISQQEYLKPWCPTGWRMKYKQRSVTNHEKKWVRKNKNAKHSEDIEEDELIDDEHVYEDLFFFDDEDDDGYFKVDIFGFQSLYRFLFVLCSITAIPLRGYPYCICLFYVFLKVDVVQYIIEALSKSRKQLLFVGFISAAVLLVFGMIAFIFLHDYMRPDQDQSLYCETLWQCFITVTREGLLDTLGPAIPFAIDQVPKTPTYTHYALRAILYDLPFYLIVTTIILNIVTAVLIDRFSELREERDAVESKKMKACFICGIESEKFERYGKGFEDHVKEDHNKWNYIYYLIHLDRKPRNDLTALEKQIADANRIEKKYGETSHYPIKRAKVLPKDKQGDKESQNKKPETDE